MSETKALKCDGCGKTVECTESGSSGKPVDPGWRRLEYRDHGNWATHTVRDFCGTACEREYEANRLGFASPAGSAGASPYRTRGAS